jgi:NAD(P)-dependent dehydrogenase (short-subunit alcohol dehydrogenase family)
MKQLESRVAIVTGASRGIGRAIAEAFAAEGARTVLAARDLAELETVVTGIRERGGEALAFKADVTREADVKALFEAATSAHDRLDILVNNAGISKPGPTDELPLEAWNQVLGVNVTGAFLCAREALRIMKPQKSGRIISIGSIARQTPRQDSVAYTTAKHALEGLTRSLALDSRAHGIAASILTLGATATSFMLHRPEEAKKVGYHMDPADVARVVVLMASLPPEVNMYEATVLPVTQPSFIGRG